MEEQPGYPQGEDPYPVPLKGEMLEGLYETAHKMTSREMKPDEILSNLGDKQDKVNQVFGMLYGQLEEMPQELPGYQDEIAVALEDVQYLFNQGLEEMARFVEDGDPARVRWGLMLSEIGEDRYLKAAAPGSTGMPREVRFWEWRGCRKCWHTGWPQGEMDKEKFQSEMELLKTSLDKSLHTAKTHLDEAFSLVKTYDGTKHAVMEGALELFEKVQVSLSHWILMLHTPGEINQAAQQISEQAPEPEGFSGVQEEVTEE